MAMSPSPSPQVRLPVVLVRELCDLILGKICQGEGLVIAWCEAPAFAHLDDAFPVLCQRCNPDVHDPSIRLRPRLVLRAQGKDGRLLAEQSSCQNFCKKRTSKSVYRTYSDSVSALMGSRATIKLGISSLR